MRAFQDAHELRQYLPEDDLFTDMRAVLGEGDSNPELVIVKRNPSWFDAKGNRPLLGNDGIPIRRAMLQAGITFYATNAFPFVAADGKVTAKQAKLAAPVIAEELRRVGGKKYLILGADAARWTPVFQYPFKKHSELLGRNLYVGDLSFRVIHAPMAVANSPALYGEFLRGVDELLHPDRVDVADAPSDEHYLSITNALQARRVLAQAGELVAVDTETTSLDPYTCTLLTIQFSWEEGRGYSFPWELLPASEWAEFMAPRKLCFQNGQYDVKVLASHGVYVRIHEDAMLMHSLVEETPGTHSMEQIAHKFLGVDKWGELVNYKAMQETAPRMLGRYGARDADLTLRLVNNFRPRLEGRAIYPILHRVANSIARSEIRGVRIDRPLAQQFSEDIEKALHDLQGQIADLYGLENPNSPKQVLAALQRLDVPIRKHRGSYTTKSDAISPFKDEFPVIRDVLEYRHLTKAGSTYVRNILDQSERDGRYHPEFKLAATETGRLAEKLITLIPRPDELTDPDLGKQYQVRLRELFIPDDGYVLIGSDYSGLEVSMAAFLTGDRQLIQDIHDRLDTHGAVAIQAFGLDIPLEPYATLKSRVSEHHAYERSLAKRGTFTWLYGGGEDALMGGMGISDRGIAQKVLAALRTRYQGVADWQDRIRHDARQDGSVSTPWGRTRRFLFHGGLDQRVIEEQLREAINAPNQGMSTDMNQAAFASLEEAGYQTLFPLHDAIYLQAPEDDAERVCAVVKETMESIVRGPVPFRVDVHTGPNWAAL